MAAEEEQEEEEEEVGPVQSRYRTTALWAGYRVGSLRSSASFSRFVLHSTLVCRSRQESGRFASPLFRGSLLGSRTLLLPAWLAGYPI